MERDDEMTKFIFVCGGVMSGIGKGITTSSIGCILKGKGLNVTAVKIDPYLNVDAGTMNPTEHGEVFVTEDGLETDQDVGNYERFLDQVIPRENYMTSGMVYKAVIDRERNLEYDGKCVEAVPHITEEVTRRLEIAGKKARANVVLVEIGGTVGEYQNQLFFEAARMMKLRHAKDVLFVLVSYLPIPDTLGEPKTKPTQDAIRHLNAMGIQPDIVIARGKYALDEVRKRKIAIAGNILEEDVISAPDATIYEVPLNFEKDHIGDRIIEKFGMRARDNDLDRWREFVERIKTSTDVSQVKIGIVGKYFGIGDYQLPDSYISVIEAVKHSAWSVGVAPEISWLDAERHEREPDAVDELLNYHGIIVPGGFGSRGVEGKIVVARFCRERKIPYFGLCYGLHMAVVEFARNVCGLKGAHTTEVDKDTPHPVIDTLPEQIEHIRAKQMGGSMRLGSYVCDIRPGTKSYNAYGAGRVAERHRHRYEVNNEYRGKLEGAGMVFAGINPDRNLIEIGEIPDHPFFVGTQFHPEFKSRPLTPHPLFTAFVNAANARRDAL